MTYISCLEVNGDRVLLLSNPPLSFNLAGSVSEVFKEIKAGWRSTTAWRSLLQSLGFLYEETRFGWSGFRTPGQGRR